MVRITAIKKRPPRKISAEGCEILINFDSGEIAADTASSLRVVGEVIVISASQLR